MNKQFYTYCHIRPDKNEVFYIGVGSDLPGRFSRAYEFGKGKRNALWNKVWHKNNKQIVVEILEVFENEQECLDKEKTLIQQYGRLCNKTGCLTNIATGGEYKCGEPTKLLQYNNKGVFVKVWECVSTVSNELNISEKAIYRAISKETSSCGYFWKWHYQDFPLNISVKTRDRNKKVVYQFDKHCKCINNYNSVFEAAKTTNVDSASIIKASNNHRTSAGGYLWSYDATCKPYFQNQVAQYSLTGELIKVYDNLPAIVKALNLPSGTAIRNCFAGVQKQAYGYVWKQQTAKELMLSQSRI